MKNLSGILNVVLLIAVAILYFLHFSSKDNEVVDAEGSSVNRIENATIVYVNSDSVVSNYEYIKDKQAELEGKSRKLDTEYKNRAQGLQAEFNNYQQNSSNLTMGQARAVEEDLLKKQQNLKLYEQSLMQELANDEAKIGQELFNKVSKVVAEYGKENDIHIVVKYNQGSDILYANEGMDITNDVIKLLNDEYKNGSIETPSDTTNVK
ncbi:MAG: OmpH family outer membrane protein [Cyclobacteriaceae bacterium]|nr:OmpH family outer membrane protein [Cyclobacteriaceae bacterium]